MSPSVSLNASLILPRCFFWGLVPLLCLLLGTSSALSDWHGEVSFLSDYVYRGYSKSRSHPVVQGHLDYEHDIGWYTGVGMSQVSFDDRPNADHADLEIKPYLGWTFSIAEDWKTELSAMGYVFNGKVFDRDADYAEYYAALHFQDSVTVRVSVAPNAYQRHVDVLDYELNYRHDIFDTLQFSAGLGYYQAGALLNKDYFYWNLGMSWYLTPYLSLDVRYVDVNLDKAHYDETELDEFYPRLMENKYLLSVTVGF